MPEIKHNFTAGKMNKDLDERLVPNGQYRDALNIQVRTTDGDSEGVGNAGVVQNLQGNSHISDGGADNDGAFNSISYITEADGTIPSTKIIGSVADEKNDKAYFFAAAPDIGKTTVTNITQATSPTQRVFVDSIVEVDTVTKSAKSIFVDRFAVMGQKQDVFSMSGNNISSPLAYLNNGASQDTPANGYDQITVIDADRYRVGMVMFAQDSNNDHLLFTDGVPGVEIVDLNSSLETLTLAVQQTGDLNTGVAFKFIHKERVLNFRQDKLITGINVIDDLLFFTDGNDEPKKINIKRSKAGTEYNYNQTQLYVQNPENLPNENDLIIISDLENVVTSDIKKEHITVIRKAPKSAPTLLMREKERDGAITGFINMSFIDENAIPSVPVEGTVKTIQFPDNVEIVNGDVFTFTSANDNFDPVVIIGTVDSQSFNFDSEQNVFNVVLTFVDTALLSENPDFWEFKLEQKRPLFETKFGRFGYRYKYEDNECSSFSPFSELAFLPGDFSYTASQGFNDGMTNTVRELIITGFIPDISIRPIDAKAIDILWKTTDNANVYIIKTITRGFDAEWKNFTDENEINTGELQISSEMIHRVLPSNQLLRSWDNVPKTAVTQEITANRLVYGNYLQGYDLKYPAGLTQSIISTPIFFPTPARSVKTDREYKFGIVIGDKYGRETPVIAYGYEDDNGNDNSGSIYLDKNFSDFSNKFSLQQNWGGDPTAFLYNGKPWIEYIKYYVKETSNEYYNLVMDRWYDAGDGNVWLAFASADRNKVDEETYLILKNEHGSQVPVKEEARYKILAIESEAPDYIKTNKNDYALILIDRDNVYSQAEGSVTGGVPDSLINQTVIKTTDGSWGEMSITDEKFKGTKKARIVGQFTTSTGAVVQGFSPFKIVTKVATTNEGSTGKIVLKDTFSQSEVDMFQKISAIIDDPSEITTANVDDYGDPDAIKYYIELRDEVVENKPQFDGRFFVKIKKDNTLRSRVLNETSGLYNILDTYEIGYIANTANNVATTGSFANAAWPADSVFTDSNIAVDVSPPFTDSSTQNDLDVLAAYWEDLGYSFDNEIGPQPVPKFGPGDPVTTQNFWEWWYSQGEDYLGLNLSLETNNTTRTASIFIDEAPAHTGYQIKYAPYAAGNWGLPASNIQVMPFFSHGNGGMSDYVSATWQNQGLSMISTPQYDSNDPGLFTIFGQHDGLIRYTASLDWPWDLGILPNWKPVGVAQGPAFMQDNRGQLTFSSIGTENGFANGKDSVFKSLMQTEGTLFRFTADPNQVVYRVMHIQQNIDTNIYGQSGDDAGSDLEIASPYEGQVNIDAKNFSANSTDTLNFRHSIITRFAKLDQDGGAIVGSGIDISVWDPRGEVSHNGMGSFTIEILERMPDEDLQDDSVITNSACWETEPKEDVGLDIYYEASSAIPIELNSGNIQLFTKASTNIKKASEIQAVRIVVSEDQNIVQSVVLPNTVYAIENFGNDGVKLQEDDEGTLTNLTSNLLIDDEIKFLHNDGTTTRSKILDHYTVTTVSGVNIPIPATRVAISSASVVAGNSQIITNVMPSIGDQIIAPGIFPNSTYVTNFGIIVPNAVITINLSNPAISTGAFTSGIEFVTPTGIYKIDKQVWNYPTELRWFNCYSFGNGVESDRIRDDFNAPTIDNGIKVSSTFLEYGQERIGSGLIHSGLYNSISSVNELNQFNMAEKITKNLNPAYGSIQALKTRDTDLVTFCEDKVLRVLANKDAVFNADGNTNLTATSKTLGQAIPFAGDYGISKNPESLAYDQYRLYFSDKQRGAVLRLSQDGLTPISNVGMKSYFREHLKLCDDLVGTFDIVNGEYNLTLNIAEEYQVASVTCPDSGCVTTPAIKPITVSFNEASKGWVSFKSFVPSSGVSVNGKYITSNTYKIYEHYDDDVSRNMFYDDDFVASEIEVVFNDQASVVKSFKTVIYEGSKAAISQITTHTDDDGNVIETYPGANDGDGEYYNLQAETGWHVDLFSTDMQDGKLFEFINKENKWFNKISGIQTAIGNIDPSELSLQGIGFPLENPVDEGTTTPSTQTEEEVVVSTLNININFLPNVTQYGFFFFQASGGQPPYFFNIQGPNGYENTGNEQGYNSQIGVSGLVFDEFYTTIVSNPNGTGGPGTYTITVTDSDGAQGQLVSVINQTNYPPA